MNLLRATLLLPALSVLVGTCSRPAAEAEDPLFPVLTVHGPRRVPRCGFIDQHGQVIIPLEFDLIESFSEGLAYAEKDDRRGFINTQGEFVIVADGWRAAGSFHEGRASVCVDGAGMGFIDKTGCVVIEPEFRIVRQFSEGLAPVNLESREGRFGPEDRLGTGAWGYVDLDGELVIPAEFSDANQFSEGLACVMMDDKYGYIDRSGGFVIKPQLDYSYGEGFSDGLALVESGDSVVFIDRTGTPAFECRFQLARPFHEGRACAVLDRHFGYIDRSGNWVISPSFVRAHDFSEGLAPVVTDSQAGYIDTTGAVVLVLPDGMRGARFMNGLAFVYSTEDNSAGYVDHSGRLVWRTDELYVPAGKRWK